ncbi:MAG: tetratricopeptide repeat protein [Candidatus Symbiothrix sp.]|jgi:tetratricopeptide (TPR) repeat protein|nr:tetratricopeptide repeat protein [Candidatus Symbiothrix sp.]
MRFLSVCLLILSICPALLKAQTYSEWIESSFKYLDENRLDSAEMALKNALKAEPDYPVNAFLFHNLGTVQRRQGKNEEALQSYTLALTRYPENTVFLSARASLFSDKGDFKNALLDYNTLLEKEPDNEEALYQRGLLYLEIKNFELSERDFGRMMELNPQSFYARLGFASLYKIEGLYTDAEKIYNYLEEKEPDNPAIYAGRAELFLLTEKGGKALSDSNKAIRLSDETGNAYLYILRSKAKLLLHEKKSAAEDIEKAMVLGYDPEEAAALLKFTK